MGLGMGRATARRTLWRARGRSHSRPRTIGATERHSTTPSCSAPCKVAAYSTLTVASRHRPHLRWPSVTAGLGGITLLRQSRCGRKRTGQGEHPDDEVFFVRAPRRADRVSDVAKAVASDDRSGRTVPETMSCDALGFRFETAQSKNSRPLTGRRLSTNIATSAVPGGTPFHCTAIEMSAPSHV